MKNSNLYSLITSYRADCVNRDLIFYLSLKNNTFDDKFHENIVLSLTERILNIYEDFLILVEKGEIDEKDLENHRPAILDLKEEVLKAEEDKFSKLKNFING